MLELMDIKERAVFVGLQGRHQHARQSAQGFRGSGSKRRRRKYSNGCDLARPASRRSSASAGRSGRDDRSAMT
jgi:hypothetical protein